MIAPLSANKASSCQRTAKAAVPFLSSNPRPPHLSQPVRSPSPFRRGCHRLVPELDYTLSATGSSPQQQPQPAMSTDHLRDLEKQKNKEQFEAEQRVLDDSSSVGEIPERKLTW